MSMKAVSPSSPSINKSRKTPQLLSLDDENNSTNAAKDGNSSLMLGPNGKPIDIRRTEITRFRVFARVRPFIEEELAVMKDTTLRSVVEMVGSRTILLNPQEDFKPQKEFDFDASLWSIPKTQKLTATFADTKREKHDTQQDVYKDVARGCVDDAFSGFNSCVLTYGQTGSGKTYTMMGKYNPLTSCGGEGDEGIIPRVCHDLFDLLEKKREEQKKVEKEQERVSFRVEVNFVEIYMEKVRDLLDPGLARGKEVMSEARIRQDPESGPFIEGVTKYKVETWSQCCQLLERGSKHRTTCATLVHQQSSRSHAIFQITVVQTSIIPAPDRYTPSTTKCQAARINLVDLAGSERGGFTDYVKESAQINKSLLALRRVIDNLVERQNILMEMARMDVQGQAVLDRPLPQVPFRDSVLTWLLSDSIGGNARTTMIATLSPLATNYGDTLATLTWSSKARNLVTVVKQNDTQSALSNKTSELQSDLLIRQQTVDGLRAVLKGQQDETERLQEDVESMKRRMGIVDEMIADRWSASMAVRVQTAVRRWLHRAHARKLRERLDEERCLLAEAQSNLEQERADLASSEALEGQRGNELAAMKTHLTDTQAAIRAWRQNKSTFEQRKTRVTAEYNLLKGQLGEDEASYRKEIEELEASNSKVRVEVTQAQERTTTAVRRCEAMTAEMTELGKRDLDGEAAAAERQLKDVNQQLEKLRSHHNQISTALELTRKQHKKTFPDKK